MKYFLPLFLVALFLTGCAVSKTPDSMPKKKSVTTKEFAFVPVTERQNAVFFVAHAWTGGMGSMPVLDQKGNIQKVDGLPVYVEESRADEIKEKLPSCIVGRPVIQVFAVISLEKKESQNTSIPDAPTVQYYVANIAELNDVKIDAKKCEE